MWFRSLIRQTILALVVIAGTVALWILYVPSAQPWLEEAGVYDWLGIEPVHETGAQSAAAWGPGGPAKVVVQEVREGELHDSITVIGDGRAARSVTVKAEATGRITEIGFASGARVEKGAVLLRLDDGAERIALDRARLMLADAEESRDRLQRLEDAGTASAVALREAELELRTAELAVRQAEYDLEQRSVLAPISGWAGLLEHEVGDRIAAQETIAVITDRSEILIEFRVPERALAKLSTGMELQAQPLALPDLSLTGEVSAIDNMVDRTSRTMRVLGRLSNEGDRLRDGMALSVTLVFPGEHFPEVDPLAVQWSSDGAFVWAVREGKAARVPVTIRQRNAGSVLVEGDLEPGDRLVVEGVQTLRPGAEVSVEGDRAAMSGTPAAPETKL